MRLGLDPSRLKSLYIIASVQMWERFSFFGLLSLMTLYLVYYVHLNDKQAIEIFGSFITLSYATSLMGGWIADHYLGYWRTAAMGGIAFFIGCLSLVILNQSLFYFALAAIASGVGFYKPNLSSLIGSFYERNDSQISRGFTLFYVASNLGAFLGAVLCGFIAHLWGWRAGFVLIAFAAFFGLMTFVLSQNKISQTVIVNVLRQPKSHIWGIKIEWPVSLALVILIGFTDFLMHHYTAVGVMMVALAIVTMVYLLITAYRESEAAVESLMAFFLYMLFFIIYSMLFWQTASSINLFTERLVDRNVLNLVIPAPALQGFNPILVLLLGPLLIGFWNFLRKKGKEPSAPAKFAWGLFQIVLAFLVLWLAAWVSRIFHSQSPLILLLLMYVLLTTGEMFIVPIGLSAVAKLAPPRLMSIMMGMWFLGNAIANYLSALIANISTVPKSIGSNHAIAEVYTHEFLILLVIAILGFLFAWAFVPILKKIG